MPPKQGDLSSEARLERATAFRLELVDRIRVRIQAAETLAVTAAKRMNEANQQALQALADMNQAMDLVSDCAHSCSASMAHHVPDHWEAAQSDPNPPTQPLPGPDVNEGNDRNDADVNEVNDAADVNEGNDGDAKANEGNDASTLQPKKQKTSHDRGTP